MLIYSPRVVISMWKDDVLAVKYWVKAVHIEKYIRRSLKMVGWPIVLALPHLKPGALQ